MTAYVFVICKIVFVYVFAQNRLFVNNSGKTLTNSDKIFYRRMYT